MRVTSRWAALCTNRGVGEQVKIDRSSNRNGYGWGGVRKEEENNDPENGRRKRWGGRARLKSKGADRDLGASRGRKRGEQNGTGTAADAGTWRGAQGQAAEASRRRVRVTSRWAALCTNRGVGEQVKIDRSSNRNGYGWGGVRKEEENNDPENGRRKRWGGRARLKSKNKRRSLCPKWSMSEVVNPPPHNFDKPHVLLASINNNSNNI